jgi:hypothetical protein
MRRPLIITGVVIVLLVVLALVAQPHMYFFARVNPDQVGVKLRGGRIVDIVPPGVYSDVGLFVSLERYSTQSYQFSATDPEVITADNQRLGVTVSGSVFRPDMKDVEMVKGLWIKYQRVYTNNDALQAVMNDLSTQAMKVCVGDRPFQDSVIGSDRDSLRTCMDEELNKLANLYGLSVTNLTVPNVTLSPEVQGLLDAITKSRLETEKAVQDKAKAVAEGAARQAEQEAAIRVEQSRLQEQTKQETVLAELERQKLVAQQAVINAQKSNDLLAAQKDLEISKAQALAAAEKAKADLARETALAALYSANPNYYSYQMSLANAGAIKETDKLIFTTEGVFPQLIFGSGISPFVAGGPEEASTNP